MSFFYWSQQSLEHTTWSKISIVLKHLFIILTLLFITSTSRANDKDSTNQPIAIVEGQSDLEMLIGLTKTTEKDKIKLSKLRNDSSRLEPLFKKTTMEFLQLDLQLDSLTETDSIQNEYQTLHHQRNELKDLLDFLLARRGSLNQHIRILDRKIHKEEEIINYIMKGGMAHTLELSESNDFNIEELTLATDSTSQADTTSKKKNFEDLREYNWRVAESEREINKLLAKLELAKNLWQYAEDLINLNLDELTISKSLLENSTTQILSFEDSISILSSQLESLYLEDSTSKVLTAIQKRIENTQQYINKLKKVYSEDSLIVVDLQARVERLNEIKTPLDENITEIGNAIEKKLRHLEYLKGPFSPHNMYAFATEKAPWMALTIVALVLIWFIGKISTRAILSKVIVIKTSKEAQKERVETLSRAVQSGLTTLIILAGILVILSQLGIDITVLLGGAAVFSLAIAFGAQSLVKDYFVGFMILTENQYRVGNVVRINNISGVVEDISLRKTVLRDLEGIAHFIPHGEITIVSNLTHKWSQVDLNIGIAYKENVDRAMQEIMTIANNMQQDPDYKHMIIKTPELLGVDALADSAVIIKVIIRTRPQKQWAVKREILRRIKNRFDELEIEIPFPHQMVYHKSLDQNASSGES